MPDKTGGKESGGGIHVQAGSGFRISNLSLSFDKATGELTAPDVQTEVRTDIFQHWLRIAQEASGEAEDAHASALESRGDDTEEFGKALGRDFRASLIAIAAAAFAIDAFYASAVHQAPDINVSCKTRDATIFETLKRGFSLTPAQQKALREPLRNLFRLRDNAVHPGAAGRRPSAIQHLRSEWTPSSSITALRLRRLPRSSPAS